MQLAELLAQIEELKAEIEKLRPLKPEVERRIMQKFRLDWNYHSNAIEGNTLTLGETRAFLMEGLTANGKPLKDHLDIKGHNELLDFLEQFIRQKERLTEAAIREMHKILLKEPYQVDAITSDGRIVKKTVHLGEYKQEQNCVRTATGEIYEYARPDEVAPKMAELLKWYEQKETAQDDHPLVIAAIFHHKFLAIHPFDDGNGRMGRILMNLILMRHGFPPAIIKLNQRDPYVASLRKADVGESSAIVSFIGQSLMNSMLLCGKAAKGESIEDIDDTDKSLRLLKLELAQVESPKELSRTTFQESLSANILILLSSIVSKTSQYDELFSKTDAAIMLEQGNSTVKKDELEKRIFEATLEKIPQRIFIVLNWVGFLKDGLNDFDFKLTFNFQFSPRKLTIECHEIGYKRNLMYQQLLSDDEISEIVTKSNKYALEFIKKKLIKGSDY